ncbi:MAG: hypothetical protein K6F20_03560 [Bacteroidaceae bacterium]|nr:hypothetical protein [Bacteroidaceae bacterium]
MCVFGTSAWALDVKDGVYQIGTAEGLVAFSELVNGGETLANAVLTADIDMTNESANFLPVGSEANPYSGTFDGQGHRISNLNISLHQDLVGLFGVIKTPAVIKNLIIDESCSIEGGDQYCGMIGIAMSPERSGDVYLENLGMEGNITLSGKNGAGIIASIYNHNFTCHLKNCYVTGNVNSGGKSGLLVGWAGD